VSEEVQHSHLQAGYFSGLAAGLAYRVQDGASAAIRFPADGPFDERMGYTRLPKITERLATRGYVPARQASFSPGLMAYTGSGYFAPYREKSHAGWTSPTAAMRRCTVSATPTAVMPISRPFRSGSPRH
jgi:hypothetical protein